MKQLSGLDASFLFVETPQMPMHVGALHIIELPKGHRGRFVNTLRRHIAQRLHLAAPLRRRLAELPLGFANPVWIDAEPDLKQHIVEIKLPKGSGQAELERKVGELHVQLLDRSRPLWKFHVFDGLAPGPDGHKRVALYTQLHHAAVDGQAAVALASAMLDLEPTPRELPPARTPRRPKQLQIGMAQLLRGAVANQTQQWGQLLKDLPATAGTLTGAARQALSRLLAGGNEVSNLALAPRTRLNASVSDTRVFAGVSLPIAELKVLAKAHDATLNDIVLFLCSTALRRDFAKHGPLPRKSMVAAVPISLREKGDTTADNQASVSLVSLGTHMVDPVQRLAHIKAATAAMKATMGSLKRVLPTDFPTLGVPWLMQAASALYARAKIAERIPPLANVAISNVPGPPVPLYWAGGKMLTNYPTSIIVHGIALNITVQSYNQSLDFGLIACGKALPEVRELADAIVIAFDDLKGLPLPHEAAGDKPRRRAGLVAKARSAVAGAVSKVTAGARASAPGKPARAR
jgi:diacylglycerol O-acyltransferase